MVFIQDRLKMGFGLHDLLQINSVFGMEYTYININIKSPLKKNGLKLEGGRISWHSNMHYDKLQAIATFGPN